MWSGLSWACAPPHRPDGRPPAEKTQEGRFTSSRAGWYFKVIFWNGCETKPQRRRLVQKERQLHCISYKTPLPCYNWTPFLSGWPRDSPWISAFLPSVLEGSGSRFTFYQRVISAQAPGTGRVRLNQREKTHASGFCPPTVSDWRNNLVSIRQEH